MRELALIRPQKIRDAAALVEPPRGGSGFESCFTATSARAPRTARRHAATVAIRRPGWTAARAGPRCGPAAAPRSATVTVRPQKRGGPAASATSTISGPKRTNAIGAGSSGGRPRRRTSPPAPRERAGGPVALVREDDGVVDGERAVRVRVGCGRGRDRRGRHDRQPVGARSREPLDGERDDPLPRRAAGEPHAQIAERDHPGGVGREAERAPRPRARRRSSAPARRPCAASVCHPDRTVKLEETAARRGTDSARDPRATSPAGGRSASAMRHAGGASRGSRWSGSLISVVAVAGVVCWALHQEPPQFPDSRASGRALAGAVALYAIATLVRGERWHACCAPRAPSPTARGLARAQRRRLRRRTTSSPRAPATRSACS